MGFFSERLAKDFSWRFDAKLIHKSESEFQCIEVFDHEFFGRTLVLDGCVQTTELDEFHYHEMLVHPVLCSLESPGEVLIIGGGDGGVLRRVMEHPVSHVVMCELDPEVTAVSNELMPSISAGAFADPRAEVLFKDGYEYVRHCQSRFDAILVDSTDLVGPAAILGSTDFYSACRNALTPDGYLIAQSGSVHFQIESLVSCETNIRGVFGSAQTYTASIPTYPGVLWSFTSAPVGIADMAVVTIDERLTQRNIQTRYYSSAVHHAAFVLPAFVEDTLSTGKRWTDSGKGVDVR